VFGLDSRELDALPQVVRHRRQNPAYGPTRPPPLAQRTLVSSPAFSGARGWGRALDRPLTRGSFFVHSGRLAMWLTARQELIPTDIAGTRNTTPDVPI
jgi:hypothetical protein